MAENNKKSASEFSEHHLNILNAHFLNSVHHMIECDECSTNPIRGLRFKCWICQDFDLCFACFLTKSSPIKNSSPHSVSHPMMVITDSYGSYINEWIGFATSNVTHETTDLTTISTSLPSDKKTIINSSPNTPEDDNKVNSLLSPLTTSTSSSSSVVSECSFCKKNLNRGYIYQCLSCPNLKICSSCFETRQSNAAHSSAHPMLRYDSPTDAHTMFVHNLRGRPFTLDSFKSVFGHVQHTGVYCDSCKLSLSYDEAPIVGLRFKCDQCNNFDLCTQCFEAGRVVGQHERHHSMVVFVRPQLIEISNEDVELGEELGRGAFGVVRKARLKSSNVVVACKILHMDNYFFDVCEALKTFLAEIHADREIKSDNVIKLLGHSPYHQMMYDRSFTGSLMLVSEYMEKGSLKKLLKNEPYLSYRRRLSIARDIACGMARIHDLSHIHRDIRPDNVLIDRFYTAKIADMGLARVVDVISETRMTTAVGCRRYLPPEFYTGEYTNKLDVFMYGLTVNELFNGSHRLHRPTAADRPRVVIVDRGELLYSSIVERCTRDEADLRPTSSQVELRLAQFKRLVDERAPRNYLDLDVIEKNRFVRDIHDSMFV